MASLPIIQGRGTTANPGNRFEKMHLEHDFDHLDEAEIDHRLTHHPTEYFSDSSKTIIATNDSPDVGFTHSINPYRGCSHG